MVALREILVLRPAEFVEEIRHSQQHQKISFIDEADLDVEPA